MSAKKQRTSKLFLLCVVFSGVCLGVWVQQTFHVYQQIATVCK